LTRISSAPNFSATFFVSASTAAVEHTFSLSPLGSLFQVLNFPVVRVGRYQRGAVGGERFGDLTAYSLFSRSDQRHFALQLRDHRSVLRCDLQHRRQ